MFPVFFGSAINCMGSLMLMDYIVDLLPNPMEGNHHKATTPGRRNGRIRRLPRRRAHGLRVQDHLRPIRQVFPHQGPLRRDHL